MRTTEKPLDPNERGLPSQLLQEPGSQGSLERRRRADHWHASPDFDEVRIWVGWGTPLRRNSATALYGRLMVE
jgi:hypothetical protein